MPEASHTLAQGRRPWVKRVINSTPEVVASKNMSVPAPVFSVAKAPSNPPPPQGGGGPTPLNNRYSRQRKNRSNQPTISPKR